ncbi:aminopeptidase P family protein [Halosquirtibacter xylanolyticus]|uniref:aminopeptidase P family protein n=1 Tax=Halosquirtibacter xylanolyticus TaxID=3374599 RepID=UPI003748DD66|nr:aminopeptidase P family protein [Prolixibacteraceae bacterium]
MTQFASRVALLRAEMQRQQLDAYVIYHSDPHLSEYLHDHFKCREWLSGFSGSYGFVVVTKADTALWTDSRYMLQAKMELGQNDIELIQDRVAGAKSYVEWILDRFPNGARVGFDARLVSIHEYSNNVKYDMIEWVDCGDLFDSIASDLSPLIFNEIKDHTIEFAGVSRERKIEDLRHFMKEHGLDHYLVTSLDEIAWLLNLRGSDISFNPVFYSFVIVSRTKINLFVGNTPPLDVKALDGVVVHAYDLFYQAVGALRETVGLDASKTTQKVLDVISTECRFVTSPITASKSKKNPIELAGAMKAHDLDGSSLLRFWIWLEQHSQDGVSEYQIGRRLNDFRSVYPTFVQDSFSPIVGYNANGAIVHYSATEKESTKIQGDGLLLIDSGGQYLMGTTDITRTFAIGEVTEDMKRDYTNVLKGVIALSSAIFPEGYAGCHLDILARTALLKEGNNYGHGTGHGVGSYLNVHEGPMSIRPDFNNEPLRVGQVLSIEPGVYKEVEYGIRIENLASVAEDRKNEFGHFNRFNTLTVFPFEQKLIDSKLLTHDEIQWVNSYHQEVYYRLKGLLSEQEVSFLKSKVKPI